MPVNAVRSCLVLLPLVLLGGCFDYTEEVHVGRDGTGRYVSDMAWLRELLTEEDLAELRGTMKEAAAQLAQHPDVAKVEVSDRADGPKHHFVLDLTTRSWEKLPAVLGAQEWLQLEKAEDGKLVRYVRVLDGDAGSAALTALADAGRRTPDVGRFDDVARNIVARVAARRGPKAARAAASDTDEVDFHVTFSVHAPKVAKSNGEVSSGRATWRWRLEDMDDQAPPRLEADLDLSRLSLVPAVVVALGLGAGLLWLRKQWKRRAL